MKILKLLAKQKILANINKASASTVHHSYFKNYKRIYRKVLRAAKALSNQNRIEKAANKSKELWKIVKELEKGKECQSKENKLLRLVLEDKTIVTDEESIGENLNDFFYKSGY